MSYHLSVLVLDGLHDEDLLVAVLDDKGVPLSLQVLADVGDEVLLLGQSQ